MTASLGAGLCQLCRLANTASFVSKHWECNVLAASELLQESNTCERISCCCVLPSKCKLCLCRSACHVQFWLCTVFVLSTVPDNIFSFFFLVNICWLWLCCLASWMHWENMPPLFVWMCLRYPLSWSHSQFAAIFLMASNYYYKHVYLRCADFGTQILHLVHYNKKFLFNVVITKLHPAWEHLCYN